MSDSAIIYGANPVLEALRSGRVVREIHVARDERGATRKLKEEALRAGVKVVDTTKDALTKRAKTARHQGVMAVLEPEAPVVQDRDLESILAGAREQGEAPLVVLVDHVQDPHNLGAIIRSAWALGAHGVVVPKDRTAPISAAVVRVSAGAALHVPIARVVNLKRALDELGEAGVWSAAAVLDGEPADEARLDGPLALVVGAEDKGVAPTLAARCDLRLRIPLLRGFDSLNASVAAGILLYEIQRQRRGLGGAAPRRRQQVLREKS